MALNKTALEQQLILAFDKARKKTENPDQAQIELAKAIATAIDTYAKTATVSTTVVGTSPSGPVTGTGTGTIS